MSFAIHFFVCLNVLLLISHFSNASYQQGALKRQRRSLKNLGAMVAEATGRESTDFLNYGNYCGLGGSGDPVDNIDSCCQMHDLCYNYATEVACRNSISKAVYTKGYKWSKSSDGSPVCGPDQENCVSTICRCDVMLTNCLKRNVDSYNSKNAHSLSLFELMKEAKYVSGE